MAAVRAPVSTCRVSKKVSEASAKPAAEAFGQHRGQAVDARGDAAQAFGAVIDGVHAGHVGQQHLGGADVGVGLLAADVLLAGLQRHAQGGLAAGVLGDADDAARHGAHVGFAGGEEGGVGPPKPSGTPKRWAEPRAMSAPSSPGDLSSTRASRSEATATTAPLALSRRSGRRCR
jgi:hypothetical protein